MLHGLELLALFEDLILVILISAGSRVVRGNRYPAMWVMHTAGHMKGIPLWRNDSLGRVERLVEVLIAARAVRRHANVLAVARAGPAPSM